VITRLLETIISRSGMNLAEVARKMGVTPNSIRQYTRGRRNRPSLQWMVRLAEVCGAKLSIEFPRVR
jgi:transcriptional regulator with XRE-family HTH domain